VRASLCRASTSRRRAVREAPALAHEDEEQGGEQDEAERHDDRCALEDAVLRGIQRAELALLACRVRWAGPIEQRLELVLGRVGNLVVDLLGRLLVALRGGHERATHRSRVPCVRLAHPLHERGVARPARALDAVERRHEVRGRGVERVLHARLRVVLADVLDRVLTRERLLGPQVGLGQLACSAHVLGRVGAGQRAGDRDRRDEAEHCANSEEREPLEQRRGAPGAGTVRVIRRAHLRYIDGWRGGLERG
jgi:hypothetical protein